MIAIAAASIALSSAFWGLMTRLWFVAVLIFLFELHDAWLTPAEHERALRRLGRAFVVGGMWAAIGMLVFGGPLRGP